MAKPLRAQRRLVPLGRRSLTLAQARRRQVRRWGVSRVSGERLMWGVRCQRAMRYLHLRPCGVRVPKRRDRPGRGCGGGAPGCGPLSPCSPTSHGVWGKWFTVKARCLSAPIAMRCGVPLVAVGVAARGYVSGGARVCTLRFCEIDKWAMSCPAVAGLCYVAEGAKEQSES